MSTTDATILLAEEHDATRAFLEDNLRADGYRVLVAADRAKALALLGTAHPDLIVVDVNGETLELLDAVRSGDGIAGSADPDTPMIVLSRDADRLQRIRLLERGGDDVMQEALRLPGAPRPHRRGAAPVARDPAGPADRARRADRDRRALARGVGVRPASRAVGDRVRAAGRAGRRATPGVHPRGAAPIGLAAATLRRAPERSTATRSGFATSCARAATTGWWSTCGASATG